MRELFYTISGTPEAMNEGFPKIKWFMREGDNYMLAFSGTGGGTIPDLWQAAMSIRGIKNIKDDVCIVDETTATCKGLTIRLHQSDEAMGKYITECRDNYLASKGL